jgi:hypothetical protein
MYEGMPPATKAARFAARAVQCANAKNPNSATWLTPTDTADTTA